MQKISEELMLKWATERLAGCDGGNIDKAKIWTCGIEWGFARGTEEERKHYYSVGLFQEILSDKKLYEDHVIYNAERISGPYDRQFLKLMATVKGHEIEQYLDNILGPDEIFKLNLFPIAFRRDYPHLWAELNLNKQFEMFQTKQDYQNWCRENRFPYFQKLTHEHKPDIVLCFGIRYVEDFFNAFGGTQLVEYKDALVDISPRNAKPRTLYYSKTISGADLYVLPFLVNRNGLNSSYLLKTVGSIIGSHKTLKDIA